MISPLSEYKAIIIAVSAAGLIALSAAAGWTANGWRLNASHASETATLQQTVHDLDVQLQQKQFFIDTEAENTKRITALSAANEKELARLRSELKRKTTKVGDIKASDCSSAIREIMNVDN